MFTFNFLHEKDKNNYVDNNVLEMTLSLNCKEAGDPVCTTYHVWQYGGRASY